MVHIILYGISEIGAHLRINPWYLIWSGHLIWSRAVTNWIFCLLWMRAQHISIFPSNISLMIFSLFFLCICTVSFVASASNLVEDVDVHHLLNLPSLQICDLSSNNIRLARGVVLLFSIQIQDIYMHSKNTSFFLKL